MLQEMMKRVLYLIRCYKYYAVILYCSATFITLTEAVSYGQSWKSYPYLKPGSKIEFPKDEGLHLLEPLEWWYANGHFTGLTTGHQYSFMLTYFYKPVAIFDGFRILTITNETTHEYSSQVLPCVYPVISTDSLHIVASFLTANSLEEWVNQVDSSGTMLPFQYLIDASTGEDSINFYLDATKPPLYLDTDGFLYQGSGNYTYYYSLTDLDLSGSVSFYGVEEDVTGIAWFDRQYGDFNPYEDESYEWFSIQLDNDMDLNIWNIFTPENSIPRTKEYRICSVISDTVSFTTQNFQIDRLSFEWTPDSQRCYATKWRIISDSMDMDLLVEVNDEKSEINITEIAMRFYEGSTKVTGKIDSEAVSGVGFAELLHSYQSPVINIIQPGENDQWDDNNPLIWNIDNPDDGNPLKYDIEIEYESKTSEKVAGGLDDTIFYWNPSVFSIDTSFNIRIVAYSSDTTLQDSTTGKFLLMPENTDLYACIGENFQIDLNLDNSNLFFKWFYNDQIASLPESSVLEIDPVTNESEGIYKCLVYNELFQDTTLEYYLDVGFCNIIGNHSLESAFIYPNPFKEYLIIHLPVITDMHLFRIKSICGVVIYEAILEGMTDKVFSPNIKPGMYVVEIISRKNQKIWSSKIIRR